MKKVLIVGVGGFLGTNLANYLLKDETIELIGIDNFSSSDVSSLYPILKNHNFNFVEGDILNGIDETVDEIYCTFGCGDLSQYFENKYDYLIKQINITDTILNQAKLSGAKALFITSFEDKFKTDKLDTLNYYNKLINNLILEYRIKYKADVKIARISEGYGFNYPKNDQRFINKTIFNAINNTDIILDYDCEKYFTFSNDIVRGLKVIMENYIDKDIIDISNPNKYRVSDIAKLIITYLKSKSKLYLKNTEFIETNYAPDIKYLNDNLNFRCSTPILDGISKTIEYIKFMYFS